MHHYDKFAHRPDERLAFMPLPDGIINRLLAAMAERRPAPMEACSPAHEAPPRRLRPYVRKRRESDPVYFARRAEEERAAAFAAAGGEARRAHLELSLLYRKMAAPARPLPRASASLPLRLAAGSRESRQDALLDAALMETFPASDPVSVAHVN